MCTKLYVFVALRPFKDYYGIENSIIILVFILFFINCRIMINKKKDDWIIYHPSRRVVTVR